MWKYAGDNIANSWLVVDSYINRFVFLKPNVDNVETKTYSKLIVLNFLFIVIGIFTYYV